MEIVRLLKVFFGCRAYKKRVWRMLGTGLIKLVPIIIFVHKFFQWPKIMKDVKRNMNST